MIRFQSSVAGDVLMLDGPAAQLLELMGHSGRRQGALMAEDIAAARQRLEAGLAAAKPEAEPKQNGEDAEQEAPVSLKQRAWPLLEMLRLAAEQKQHVSWGS